MPKLPAEFDPYGQQTPYDILGVKPSSSTKDIRNRHTSLKRDIQESGLSPSERDKKLRPINEAYDQLRVSSNRIQVDFYFVDNEVGLQQCRKIAASVGKPQTDVGDLIRPKKITVNHLALVDTLEDFRHRPDKVVGFHPHATGLGDRLSIPEPLQVQFDC